VPFSPRELVLHVILVTSLFLTTRPLSVLLARLRHTNLAICARIETVVLKEHLAAVEPVAPSVTSGAQELPTAPIPQLQLMDILLSPLNTWSGLNCEDADATYQQHIEDTIRYQLGSWSGSSHVNHKCTSTGTKRDDSATIETQARLSGDGASDQGRLLTTNTPQTTTTNGVTYTLVSAESEDRLTNAEIAGIVIGSVIAAMLVLITIVLVLYRRHVVTPRTA